jgi:chemotaxis protein MotB
MAIEEDPPAGVPEWVVTYGDMMSLLLTFFIMLVSLSELKGDKKYQAMVASIMKRMGYELGPDVPPGNAFPLDSAIAKLRTLGAQAKKEKGHGGVKVPGPEGQDLRVFKGREGTSISMGGPMMFLPGSDELAPGGAAVVSRLALELAGKPNKVDIRGHTTRAAPAADSPWKDNFELGYARARRIYDLFLEQGISKERLRISSAADTEPLPAGNDNKPKYLDRVEVYALDAFSREFVGPRE